MATPGARCRALWPWLLVGVLGASTPVAHAQIELRRWTVDAGGMGFVQASPFITAGTIGQAEAGLITDGAPTPTTIVGGFWIPAGPIPVGVGPPPGSGDSPGDSPAMPLAIHPALPNPTSARTEFGFDLPAPAAVSARVFDVAGSLVHTLADRVFPQGRYVLAWDATDAAGQRVRTGVYWIRIRVGTLERAQKIVVLR